MVKRLKLLLGVGGVGGDSLGYKKESEESILSTYNILLSLHTKKRFFEPNNKHYFEVCVCVYTLGLRTLKGLGPPES
jgi:hypothetical protein